MAAAQPIRRRELQVHRNLASRRLVDDALFQVFAKFGAHRSYEIRAGVHKTFPLAGHDYRPGSLAADNPDYSPADRLQKPYVYALRRLA